MSGILTMQENRISLVLKPLCVKFNLIKELIMPVARTADHRRMRRILAHAFSETAIAEQEPLVMSYVALLIGQLGNQATQEPGQRIELTKWYNFITFDIIGDLCMGEPFNTLQEGRYHPWIFEIFRGLKFVGIFRLIQVYPLIRVLWTIFLATSPHIANAQKAHFEYTAAKIKKRIERKTERKDFITYVLEHCSFEKPF